MSNIDKKYKIKDRNLIGEKFGRLIVIEKQPNKGHYKIWLCQCECGSEPKSLYECHLIGGKTLSCGCISKEKSRDRWKKYNTYDLSGEYGIGYSTKGELFYFDLEDYEKIKDYCWNIDSAGYVYTNVNKNVMIRMHRLIMDAQDGEVVDHIYHVRHDNRKSELRRVTQMENTMNRRLSKSNKSGKNGVHWSKEYSKWVSVISVNKKRFYLGSYNNLDDAIKARNEAELQHFGELVCKEK